MPIEAEKVWVDSTKRHTRSLIFEKAGHNESDFPLSFTKTTPPKSLETPPCSIVILLESYMGVGQKRVPKKPYWLTEK